MLWSKYSHEPFQGNLSLDLQVGIIICMYFIFGFIGCQISGVLLDKDRSDYDKTVYTHFAGKLLIAGKYLITGNFS